MLPLSEPGEFTILNDCFQIMDSSHNVGKGDLKWHTRVKQQISDFQIPAQVWHWQDGSSIAKSLQEPPTKFVTSYLEIGYISCVFPSRNLCPISMLLGAL
ncbi:hypothetical protein PV325_013232 [Microctonus aethiopoides]|nr:hypothetical protein PV325_013232 [Microctonus aethiopoides]KAK0094320.1 hypothetical protein PV326_011269 [Microctonus aethiopoides]